MSATMEVGPLPSAIPPVDQATRQLEAAARDGRELASPEGASGELLKILAQLGPVHSGFARYLATRADVVPAGLRAHLAGVPDQVPSAPFAEVLEVLSEAWRARVEDVCVQVEEVPVETRFPTQCHRAWLTPTDAVIVRCVPPSFETRVSRELRTLSILSTALAPALAGAGLFDGLVEGYGAVLQRQLDLSGDLAASEALLADARRFPALLAARPHAGLSSRRVAVWDEVASVSPEAPGFDRAEAGADICRAWLRQALLGRTFPEEAEPHDFIVAGGRRISVGGRLFAHLTTDAQMNVQGYLVAAAAGDPDLSVRFLMRELEPRRAADAAGLQRRIRHAWSVDSDAAGGSELLAQLLLHWRIAVEHGYQPTAGLASFYRGCLAAVHAAVSMGAEDDVLQDALATLQIRLVASQVETLTGVSPTNARSAREAGWRLITTLASGPIASDHGPGASEARLPVFGSLLLALTAIGVAMPSLVSSGAAWADPLGASLFAVIGGLLLFLVTFAKPAS